MAASGPANAVTQEDLQDKITGGTCFGAEKLQPQRFNHSIPDIPGRTEAGLLHRAARGVPAPELATCGKMRIATLFR